MTLCSEKEFQKKEISLIWLLSVDLVKKSGAWYAYEGDKIGQGRENAKTYLSAHPEIMEELEKKVREHYQLGTDSSEKDAERS